MKKFKELTLDEILEYNRKEHDASKEANIFCNECCYSSNGVLDSYCDLKKCPEMEFSKQFQLEYMKNMEVK